MGIGDSAVQRLSRFHDEFHRSHRTLDLLKSRPTLPIENTDDRSAPRRLGCNGAESVVASRGDARDVGEWDYHTVETTRPGSVGLVRGFHTLLDGPGIDLETSHLGSGNRFSFRGFTYDRHGD
jgi:hypothetical protein